MGTIQFISSLHDALSLLTSTPHFHTPPVVPQAKPLSPGEVLGCTAPTLPQGAYDVLVFVADGRFHLEVRAHPSRQAAKLSIARDDMYMDTKGDMSRLACHCLYYVAPLHVHL